MVREIMDPATVTPIQTQARAGAVIHWRGIASSLASADASTTPLRGAALTRASNTRFVSLWPTETRSQNFAFGSNGQVADPCL